MTRKSHNNDEQHHKKDHSPRRTSSQGNTTKPLEMIVHANTSRDGMHIGNIKPRFASSSLDEEPEKKNTNRKSQLANTWRESPDQSESHNAEKERRKESETRNPEFDERPRMETSERSLKLEWSLFKEKKHRERTREQMLKKVVQGTLRGASNGRGTSPSHAYVEAILLFRPCHGIRVSAGTSNFSSSVGRHVADPRGTLAMRPVLREKGISGIREARIGRQSRRQIS